MEQKEFTVEELVQMLQEGQSCYDEIYNRMQNLIVSIARKYAKMLGLSIEDKKDMQQVGNIALLAAAKQYDATKETKFSTYAVIRARGAFKNWLVRKRNNIKVPEYLMCKISEINKAEQRYKQETGKEIPVNTLMERCSLTEEELTVLRDIKEMLHPQSLDETFSDEDGNDYTLKDTLVDPEDKYESVEREDFNKKLWETLKKILSKQEYIVIEGLFLREMTAEELAMELHVKKDTIKAYKEKAIKKLKTRPIISRLGKEFGIKTDNE